MDIQIINYEEVKKYKSSHIIETSLEEPRSFDEFSYVFVDITDDRIWEFEGNSFSSIDMIKDFDSIRKMVETTVQAVVIYVLPNNCEVSYDYSGTSKQFFSFSNLKNEIDILCRNIIPVIIPEEYYINLQYERTTTNIAKLDYSADFILDTGFFTKVTSSYKSDKVTTIKLDHNIYVTALNVTQTEEKVMNFIKDKKLLIANVL